MKTHESEEMYLETILLLQKKHSVVRSVDVVEELGYAKSSVSRAVNLLVSKGYVTMNEAGELTLTESGEQKAAGIYERHQVITEFFIELGADSAVAEENACRIEHVISEELFRLVKDRVKRGKETRGD